MSVGSTEVTVIQAMLEGTHRARNGIVRGLVLTDIADCQRRDFRGLTVLQTVGASSFRPSIGSSTILVAFIFKVLPKVSLQWGDVIIGAVLTSFLFTGRKIAVGRVPRQGRLYRHLWRGGLSGVFLVLGVLLGPGPVFRR